MNNNLPKKIRILKFYVEYNFLHFDCYLKLKNIFATCLSRSVLSYIFYDRFCNNSINELLINSTLHNILGKFTTKIQQLQT